MEQNTVLISLEKYEELIDLKYQIKDFKKEVEELKKQTNNLKNTLLESQVDDYNICHYELNEITNFNSYSFGLKEKLSLLRFFSKDELVEFIKAKKEQCEKEDE